MTQKTAMQIFKEWVKSFPYVLNQNDVEAKIEELLATEKEHIIDTYKYALPANMSEAQKQDEAEFFYNSKYGQ